jgi:hypothetical protein
VSDGNRNRGKRGERDLRGVEKKKERKTDWVTEEQRVRWEQKEEKREKKNGTFGSREGERVQRRGEPERGNWRVNTEEEETERGCRKQKRYGKRMQRMLQRVKRTIILCKLALIFFFTGSNIK